MAEEARSVVREPGRDDAVSYEGLQDLLRAERRSNKLMPLPPRFWILVREFLQAVTDAFRLEQAKDPFGRRVMRLTDEVKNARHAAESVWALRERKLAMLALAATKDRKHPDGITPEEASVYRQILDALDAGRATVFDGILPAPSAAPATPGPAPGVGPVPSALPPVQLPIDATARIPPPGATPEPRGPLPTPAAPSSPPEVAPATRPPPPAVHVVPPDTRSAGAAAEMVTIRALGDIPPFVGPDMQTYLLKSGDIATVPPSIANLLVRRNKAVLVD